jgi:hypothetical protein
VAARLNQYANRYKIEIAAPDKTADRARPALK